MNLGCELEGVKLVFHYSVLGMGNFKSLVSAVKETRAQKTEVTFLIVNCIGGLESTALGSTNDFLE